MIVRQKSGSKKTEPAHFEPVFRSFEPDVGNRGRSSKSGMGRLKRRQADCAYSVVLLARSAPSGYGDSNSIPVGDIVPYGGSGFNAETATDDGRLSSVPPQGLDMWH